MAPKHEISNYYTGVKRSITCEGTKCFISNICEVNVTAELMSSEVALCTIAVCNNELGYYFE